jgi:hypothetical protein
MRTWIWIPMLALLSACGTKYIPTTQIEDTEENRQLLRVVEQYRRAVEDKDVARILELTSDSFFEDPGTPGDPSDDYDKAGLKVRLEEAFAKLRDQKLDISVRKLHWIDDEKEAQVEYAFDYRYQLDMAGAGEWRADRDLNQVTLRREGDTWRIVSGI